jgi:peptide/nickel transport system substrate-binding protein
MGEEERGWKRFQRLKVSSKDISRRAKKAEGATLRHAHKFLVNRWDNIRDVRRRIIGWMFGVALLITAVGFQMLWFQRSYVTQAPVSGGVYAEAAKGPIATLNPLYATSSAEGTISRLLFSSLYNYDTTGHLKNDLASSTKVDASGKVYTLTVRPDAKWQDGYSVTAKDIVFTVELMKNPSTRSVMSASWQDVTAIATSDYTVQFTLPAAYAAFPQALTFAVLPQHVLKDVDPRALRESSFSNGPTGSGPFTLRLLQPVDEQKGRKIVHLASNETYYRGKPKLERFQLHVYGSTEAIGTALRTGEVSAANDVSSDVARSIDTKRYDILAKPVNSGVYALFNTTQPYLKSVKVRKALQLSTDTNLLRKELYATPLKLDLPFVDGQLTGAGIPQAAVPSRSEAAKLLDSEGWAVGADGIRTKEGQPLKLRVVTRKNNEYERTLEVLAGQWRKLGVQIETEVVDSTGTNQSFTQTVLQPRNYDVLVDELYIGGDPDVFAYWHSRGLLNLSNYSNVVSDDALSSARSRSEPELRNVKYKTFAAQWLADVPAIGLYQSNMLYARTKTVTSIGNDDKLISPAERYAGILNWTADRGAVYKTP